MSQRSEMSLSLLISLGALKTRTKPENANRPIRDLQAGVAAGFLSSVVGGIDGRLEKISSDPWEFLASVLESLPKNKNVPLDSLIGGDSKECAGKFVIDSLLVTWPKLWKMQDHDALPPTEREIIGISERMRELGMTPEEIFSIGAQLFSVPLPKELPLAFK